jgi:glutathione S-transferase
MPTLELSYFDFDGGRGEPARLALYIAGIEFEDLRIPLADWRSVRADMPFRALPVLRVDAVDLAQSNTINRYVGRLGGLYPVDAWQAALCDEVMDAVEDIVTAMVATFFIEDEEEKKTARQGLVAGSLALYLERIQSRLIRSGGEYFADGRLTVADLKVYVWIRNLRSGILDHIPTDLPDRVAPHLIEHFERINAHPKVSEYYARRGK